MQRKGFFGKNWPIPIITIVFLLFTLYAYGVYEEAKQAEMKRPLRKADFYLLFIFTGVFGIPFYDLRNYNGLHGLLFSHVFLQ